MSYIFYFSSNSSKTIQILREFKEEFESNTPQQFAQ